MRVRTRVNVDRDADVAASAIEAFNQNMVGVDLEASVVAGLRLAVENGATYNTDELHHVCRITTVHRRNHGVCSQQVLPSVNIHRIARFQVVGIHHFPQRSHWRTR